MLFVCDYSGLGSWETNELSPFTAWPIGSSTIGWCELVALGVALLEEVYHCGVGFEVSYMLKLHPVHSISFYCLQIKM